MNSLARHYFVLFIFLLVLQIADFCLTIDLITNYPNFKEGNPLVKYLVDNNKIMFIFIIKIFSSFALFQLGITSITDKTLSKVQWFQKFFNGSFTFVVIMLFMTVMSLVMFKWF